MTKKQKIENLRKAQNAIVAMTEEEYDNALDNGVQPSMTFAMITEIINTLKD